MWDLNRAERKALGTALVLVGVSIIARTVLAPDPGRLDGLEKIDPERDLRGVEGDVISALVREQRAQTPLAEGERVDVNHASVDELRRLPGVGPSLAQAIVEERERDPFRAAGDLKRVAGVGEVTAGRLAPHLRFEPAPLRPGFAGGSPRGPSGGLAGCPPGGSLVDLNRASREQLESLPGIGSVIANRIVDDRLANGPFERPQALTRVSGIGDRSLARLADRICAGTP
ncbi:ComEA family DNA-binding protein [Candidatus Palauibacter sp.]|uniref:ComEA family DNA-binding protein n=1 Tax=Candidatus Palauibacter sp. TaxID=3101350 RepID=UPI003B5CFF1D